MRALIVFALVLLVGSTSFAQDEEGLDDEEQLDEDSPKRVDPAESERQLVAAHAEGRRDHVISVMRVDSAIESLNDGTVQVYGTRREYRCPTGELVSESSCSPCTHPVEQWGSRPTGVWLYEVEWDSGDEASHAAALARLEHFRKHFELVARGGAENGERRATFFEHTGRIKPPPEPARATRVIFFVGAREATAAVIPADARSIEIEARAQGKGESGTLEDLPQAAIAFSSACGQVRATGPRKALFSLNPMVGRCELLATATPGPASAAIGVTRAVEVQITYEGQAADEILLDGERVVVLRHRGQAGGAPARIAPEWKAEGGTVELLEGGASIRLRLAKGVDQAEVTLLDRKSGAGDSVRVRVKKPE